MTILPLPFWSGYLLFIFSLIAVARTSSTILNRSGNCEHPYLFQTIVEVFPLFTIDYESPLDCKKIQPVHPKGDQSWVFIGRTDVETETPVLWPPHAKSWPTGRRPWCWEGLGAGGEADDRGWDGWMASLTRWTWVWVDSRSWWWTGRPGMLQFMGLQRVGHNWVTELNWTELCSLWVWHK